MTARVPIAVLLLLALGWAGWRLGCSGGAREAPRGFERAEARGAERPDPGQDLEPVAKEQPARRADEPRSASAPRAPAAAAASDPARVATHLLRGRVLDSSRFPLAGVTVELEVHGLGPVTTAEDGSFELAAMGPGDERPALVRAHDGPDTAAQREILLPEQRAERLEIVEVEPLVLRPSHALRVRVLDAGRAVPGARVRVQLGSNRAGDHERVADARGELFLTHLPRGAVHLIAGSRDRGGRAHVFVPEDPTAEIELEALGEAEVQVVDTTDGSPVAGAALEVRERVRLGGAFPGELAPASPGEYWTYLPFTRARTDEEGRARIHGLEASILYAVQVEAPGFISYTFASHQSPLIHAGGAPARIELVPLFSRSVRWPIVPGEVGVPADGSTIALRHTSMRRQEREAPPPARMQGSWLVGQVFFAEKAYIAEAPDGSLAEVWSPSEGGTGEEASFRRPRSIEVRVRDASGAPVEGASVRARDRSNSDLLPARTTGPDGIARLEQLHGGPANVYVTPPRGHGHARCVGRVDLDEGDAVIEATLPAWLPARLAVAIDGRRRLPAQYVLWGNEGQVCRVIAERPLDGELELSVEGAAPGATLTLALAARGHRTAAVDLTFPADGSPASSEVALERLALLVVTVRGEGADPPEILPERFDEESRGWQLDRTVFINNGLRLSNGPHDTYAFEVLARGRVRAVDRVSGETSSEAELLEGQLEARVELVLSQIQWVSGVVEVEDPAELERVRVLVLGPDAEPTHSSALPGSAGPRGAYAEDGTFRVRVPGDQDVRVTPWHPWLMPAANGSVELRGGRDGVVLRLVRGDELRLVSPQLAQLEVERVRIARFAGEPTGEPLAWHHAPLVGGIARCSMPRGRWTLWVDPGAELAPFVLRDVSIAGSAEIAAPLLERGSALRLVVRIPEGQTPPLVSLTAERLGALPYLRTGRSRGEPVLEVPGLGAGRHRVTLHSLAFPRRELEVELDGAGEHELELDLR